MNLDSRFESFSVDIEQKFSLLSLNNFSGISQSLQSAIQKVLSNIPDLEIEGIKEIRLESCKFNDPPIESIINSSILPILIQKTFEHDETFAFEVTWVLCNIACGDSSHCKYLLSINVLQFFEKIFDSNHFSDEIRDHIVWTIGNIAGDSYFCRDEVNSSLMIEKIIMYGYELSEKNEEKNFKNCVWAVSNMVRGNPPPDQTVLGIIDDFLIAVMPKIQNSFEILQDLLWGLSWTSESLNYLHNYFEGALDLIINFLTIKNLHIQVSSLKIILNFILKVENPISKLPLNLFQAISPFLFCQNSNLHKQAVLILSNLALKSSEAVRIMLELEIFQDLIIKIRDEEKEIFNDAINIVTNSFISANRYQVRLLADIGWVEIFLDLFSEVSDSDLKISILEGLKQFALKDFSGFNQRFTERVRLFKEDCEDEKILIEIDGIMDIVEMLNGDKMDES